MNTRAAALVAMLLPTFGCAGKRIAPPEANPGVAFRALGSATWGLTAADLGVTELGLSRGLVEANPVMRNRAVRVGAKAAWAWSFNAATDRAWHRGKRKTAWAARIALVAFYGVVVGRNLAVVGASRR